MTDHKPFTVEQLDEIERRTSGPEYYTIAASKARVLIAQAREEIRLREALEKEAKSCRDCANNLRREIANGIAIRQSIESKDARAQVLESHADALYRILRAAKESGR